MYRLYRCNLVPPQVEKYTYEVCPFSKANQKEGHSSTSLGSWQGLEGEGEGALRCVLPGLLLQSWIATVPC